MAELQPVFFSAGIERTAGGRLLPPGVERLEAQCQQAEIDGLSSQKYCHM